MRNIAYVIKESHMSFNEVMELPYSVFLSLLKQFRIFHLEETPEGQEMLQRSRILDQKEPDWNQIRNSKNYQKK